ncbi:MAG TPA: RNB domain-containing ribonuclease, partial [Vicinamibacteria bacterium]|nr:RNB domain-containing ribonuclease [Vicinamibacteria bacterium]
MSASGREQLRDIARRAMVERSLQPDFPRAALAEAGALSGQAPADGSVRDLRSLAWASIDNDDSRDLDQLSVAEALAGGASQL